MKTLMITGCCLVMMWIVTWVLLRQLDRAKEEMTKHTDELIARIRREDLRREPPEDAASSPSPQSEITNRES